MVEHDIQCFYGVQEVNYEIEEYDKATSGEANIAEILPVEAVELGNSINLQVNSHVSTGSKAFERSSDFGRRFNALANHVANEHTDAVIEFINMNNLGWTANNCMLQTNHPDYGS